MKKSFKFTEVVKVKHIVVFARECSYCGRTLDDNGKCPSCG